MYGGADEVSGGGKMGGYEVTVEDPEGSVSTGGVEVDIGDSEESEGAGSKDVKNVPDADVRFVTDVVVKTDGGKSVDAWAFRRIFGMANVFRGWIETCVPYTYWDDVKDTVYTSEGDTYFDEGPFHPSGQVRQGGSRHKVF